MEIWQFDLRHGSSPDPREGACLLDAVSWFEYGTLGDHPPCVCPVIASFARIVNDMLPDERRQELKPFILRLPGTVDPNSEQERAEFLMWQAIRIFAPLALEAAASVAVGNHAAQLRMHAAVLRGQTNQNAAGAAGAAAWAAARAAARAAEEGTIYDLSIAALDGVLRIGKQAEPIIPAAIGLANRSFALARA